MEAQLRALRTSELPRALPPQTLQSLLQQARREAEQLQAPDAVC